MKKRMLAAALSAVMAVSLSACTSGGNAATAAPEAKTEAATTEEAKTCLLYTSERERHSLQGGTGGQLLPGLRGGKEGDGTAGPLRWLLL